MAGRLYRRARLCRAVDIYRTVKLPHQMKKSTKHLPPEKRAQLKELRQIAISLAKPEKIFLFGLFAQKDLDKVLTEIPQALQVFDLLVLVRCRNPKEME